MTTPPGPLAEEAAKLVEALSDWARMHAGDLPDAFAHQVGGSAECRLCPVCQTIGLLRHARPETFGHLLEASAALTAALRSMVEAGDHQRGRGSSGVERIDLDDDVAADDVADDTIADDITIADDRGFGAVSDEAQQR